ncbi:MAG: hypothetical protein RPU73_01945 [Candidatus Sedimenticola sp. (ex Thyasira tokunagai)]
MAFADLKKKVATTCFAKLGDPGIYTSVKTGVPKRVTVIEVNDIDIFPGGFESSVSESVTQLDLLRSEVTNPRKGDTIKIGAEVLTFDDVLPGNTDPTVVKVVVK